MTGSKTTEYWSTKYPPEKRLWEKIQAVPGCWEWTGNLNKYGYGTIKISGRRHLAHRVVFEQTFGKIPPGMFICHHCDNPKCCRPDHLFLGTAKDNTSDMMQKGRHNSVLGYRTRNTKLTDDDVIFILKSQLPCAELAGRFRISPQTIRGIKGGRKRKRVYGQYMHDAFGSPT